MPRTFFLSPDFSQRELMKNSEALDDILTQGTRFNHLSARDRELISSCTSHFLTQLTELQKLDNRIIKGFAIGTSAFMLSYILPLGIVSIAGFSYSAYYMGKRERVANEYHAALENLVGCFEWTLSDVHWAKSDVRGLNRKAINECIPVVEMFKAIAPFMSNDQLKMGLDDSIEADFLNQAKASSQDQHLSIINRPLNQEERAVFYGMYGYKQGTPMDVARGLYYLICQGFNWVKHEVSCRLNHHKNTSEIRGDVSTESKPTTAP